MSSTIIDYKPNDAIVKDDALFTCLSVEDENAINGGFWNILLPAVAVVGTSVYMSIKHKGFIVGYDSKVANGVASKKSWIKKVFSWF